jgi:hypothetical protein
MSSERPSLSLSYIETEIPSGLTIADWRAQRAARRPRRRARSWWSRSLRRVRGWPGGWRSVLSASQPRRAPRAVKPLRCASLRESWRTRASPDEDVINLAALGG